MVADLLRFGACPNVTMEDGAGGAPPIYLACQKGDLASLKMLLDHGADVTISAATDLSHLEIAVEGNHVGVIHFLVRECGVEVEPKALLHCVQRADNVDALEALLALGAPKGDNIGSTVFGADKVSIGLIQPPLLHVAAQSKRLR